MGTRKRRLTTKLPTRKSVVTLPQRRTAIGRNEPCPCGSGKKFKQCHASEGAAFLEKLAMEQEKEERKVLREQLKEKGVPWYRRLFFTKS